MSSERLPQLAMDVTRIDEALRIAEAVYPRVDIVEIGTPLILEQGSDSRRQFARFPFL